MGGCVERNTGLLLPGPARLPLPGGVSIATSGPPCFVGGDAGWTGARDGPDGALWAFVGGSGTDAAGGADAPLGVNVGPDGVAILSTSLAAGPCFFASGKGVVGGSLNPDMPD